MLPFGSDDFYLVAPNEAKATTARDIMAAVTSASLKFQNDAAPVIVLTAGCCAAVETLQIRTVGLLFRVHLFHLAGYFDYRRCIGHWGPV